MNTLRVNKHNACIPIIMIGEIERLGKMFQSDCLYIIHVDYFCNFNLLTLHFTLVDGIVSARACRDK